MTDIKAINFGARAGETITGDLGRGSDGKFTNAGSSGGSGQTPDKSKLRQAIGLEAKPKKGKAAGGGKGKGGAAKPTDEQKAAEKQAKIDANRKTVATGLGVSDDDTASLAALAAGGEPGDTTDLEKRGLVERGGDGAPRLTTSGTALNTAMNRGDLGAAKRVLSVAQDRKAKKDQQAADKAERDQKKAEKQAEKDRKAGKAPAPAPAPAPVEAATMTALATAVQAAITAWIERLTAAKAISADRAIALEDTAALFAGHLAGIDEELVEDAIKAGRRNSSSDAAMLQSVHDMSVKLGADCVTPAKPTLKSLPAGMSYDQAREAVRDAIKDQFAPEPDTVIASSGELIAVDRDYYCWVVELYEDTAIYSDKGDDLYRVSYAFTGEGILLGEPVKVKRVTQYVPEEDYAVIKSATDGASFVDYLPPVRQDGQPYDNPYAVKALGGDRIGGYAVLFGDATRTDLTGDYFTKSTEFWFDEFGEKRPMLYQHAVFDPATKADPVVGTWDTFRVDDIGVWTEGQLKKAHKYKQAIQQLVDAGVLGLSSGSAPNLVLKSRKQRANEITRWPILEVSLTPEPAEPRMTPVTAIKSYFADAGLDLPAALVDASDTPAPTAGAEAPTSAQSVDDRARRLNVELDLLELSLP